MKIPQPNGLRVGILIPVITVEDCIIVVIRNRFIKKLILLWAREVSVSLGFSDFLLDNNVALDNSLGVNDGILLAGGRF